jgi:osmoprotectant transport system permease protein
MSRRARIAARLLFGFLLLLWSGAAGAEQGRAALRVGSKRFTESYILAEIVVASMRAERTAAVHEQGLGGTAVTYRALEDGAIDVYPEYTGTIAETVLKDGPADLAQMRPALEHRGIGVSEPLGFQNTYALALSPTAAAKTKTARISELARHKDLRIALSHEFIGRSDGWAGLAAHYGLLGLVPTAIDHALAYEALAGGSIDVTDVYTTDAKIERYGLVVLDDDRHFFPPYEAVLLYRIDALDRHPALGRVLSRLRGAIDAQEMRRLNARAELDGAAFPRVAAEFLGATSPAPARDGFASGLLSSIVRNGPRHLELVFGAIVLATLIGVPLGVLAYTRHRVGAVVLGVTGVIQTIPSLALFCFFIPLLGIGPMPALAALCLYGLLPIARNTHAGLASIPGELRDSALALGLSRWERLRNIELPLASRTILAGIKTSAVVAVGSATIAAFIGAGGFGEPISTGLSLNDVPTILQGALPAAALALVVQGAFEVLERVTVPRGLRP